MNLFSQSTIVRIYFYEWLLFSPKLIFILSNIYNQAWTNWGALKILGPVQLGWLHRLNTGSAHHWNLNGRPCSLIILNFLLFNLILSHLSMQLMNVKWKWLYRFRLLYTFSFFSWTIWYFSIFAFFFNITSISLKPATILVPSSSNLNRCAY